MNAPKSSQDLRVVARIRELEDQLRAANAARDEYQHRLRVTASTRWARLGQALRTARRSPRALLLLPVTVLRILFRPHPTPARVAAQPVAATAAAPRRPDETASTTTRMRRRLLAPRTATPLSELRVAGVLDEFTRTCLAPNCRLEASFRPDNFRETLDLFGPDLVFVESAWRGNTGSWQYQIGTYSHPESVGLPALTALVYWCRDNAVPVVFWNKEDPVHFDRFKEAAQLANVVFTTDANSIARYEALPRLAAEHVAALPFAAQPAIHTPIGAPTPRKANAVFAGSFYRNRHPARAKQLEDLLDAAVPYGLQIYDRNNSRITESFGFPERFHPYIAGGLPYDQMVRAYREYRLFLNVNSVMDSPTMFSRRVFELLASGTPVVSTPSVGLEGLLPGIVAQVEGAAEAQAAIETLMTDDQLWHARSLEGRRAVLSEHTYAHRLATVAASIGLRMDLPAEEPVTAIVMASDKSAANAHLEALARVRPDTDMLVVGDATAAEAAHPRRQDVGDASSIDEDLRTAAARSSSPWLLLLGDGPAPSHHEVTDLELARHLAPAECYGFADASDRYVDNLLAGPVLASADAIRRHGWRDGDGAEARAHGSRLFAVSRPATS